MNDHIPYAVPPKYGLIDAAGKFIVQPTWDEGFILSPDWIWIRVGSKQGLVDKTGRVHIPPAWDELEVLPVRSGSLAEDGKEVLIGREAGTPILSPWVRVMNAGMLSILRLADAQPVFPAANLPAAEFVDFYGTGQLVLREPDATAGFILSLYDPATKKQTRLPAAAKLLWNWNTATAGLLWAQDRTSQRWHLLRQDGSDTGHSQPEIEKPTGWGFTEERALLHGTDGWRHISKDGQPISTERWEQARPFSGGRAAVMRGQKWGFVAPDGSPATALDYDEVLDFSLGLAAVLKEGRWGYIDPTGRSIIPPIWDEAQSFTAWQGEPAGGTTPMLEVAEVKFSGSAALIDREGRLIIDPANPKLTREGAAYVNGADQFIVMLKNGKPELVKRAWKPAAWWPGYRDKPLEVSPAIRWQKDGFAHVLVDHTGKVLTPKSGFIRPRTSSQPDPLNDGLIHTSKVRDDMNGLIRKDGTEVLPPSFERIAWIAPGVAAVWSASEGGLIDAQGRWLFKDTAEMRVARFATRSGRSQRQHRHGLALIEDVPHWGYARLNREPAPAPKP